METISPDALTAIVKRTCVPCHNDQLKSGDRTFQHFDVAKAALTPETAEKMIGKLQAGMMPPPGMPRPGGDTLAILRATLERLMDENARLNPESGARAFQRLNRAEYERSIRDLLNMDVDAGRWLPLDTKSANFDNIADAQTPSATLLDGYMDAASEISRLAVGDPHASTGSTTYKLPRLASQWEQVEGAPAGTGADSQWCTRFQPTGSTSSRSRCTRFPPGSSLDRPLRSTRRSRCRSMASVSRSSRSTAGSPRPIQMEWTSRRIRSRYAPGRSG
jgi:hypothetical protein